MSVHILPHQAQSDADTRQVPSCIPSEISLNTLDAKWKETAGNRTDTNIKNVLMTTYSEMYLQVPTLAILKVMDTNLYRGTVSRLDRKENFPFGDFV